MKKKDKEQKDKIINNTDQNKKINKVKIIPISIVVIIIVAYVILKVFNLLKNPTDTVIVTNGILSKEETINGYIIRDETLIEGEDYKNGIIKIKEEGERVAKGDSVFRYYSVKEKDLEENVAKLDKQIQEILENEDNTFSSDKKLLETQIEEEIDKIYELNNMKKISEYKKTINTYITKKAKIIGSLSPSGSYLKNLIEERTKYEQQLAKESENITAPISGLVSYKTDGLEKILTIDNLENLNQELLEGLNLKNGQVVSSSETTGKIVNNFTNYIIFNSSTEESKNANINDKIKIRLQNNTEITATIANIIEEKNGSRTIAIKVERNTEEFLQYRKISFDIIWWSASGFKIPNSAIKQIGDISYVIRNRNGYLNKMAVKVLKEGENFSIVKPYTREELQEMGLSSEEISNLRTLILYDEIVLSPKEEMLQ